MTADTAALIERHMERPLGPGEPCFAPVADALVALGHPDLSGAYGALTRAELRCLPDPPAAIGRALGAPEIDPREARMGDVGTRRLLDGGWTVGVKARAWLWKTERGLIVGGLAERAWRVG